MNNINDDELPELLNTSNVVPFHNRAKKSEFEELREAYDSFVRDANNWYGDWVVANKITNDETHYDIRNHICTHRRLNHDAIAGQIEFGKKYGVIPQYDDELIRTLMTHWSAKITFAGVLTATINHTPISKIEILKANVESIVRQYKLSVPAAAIENEICLWRDNRRSELVKTLLSNVKYDANVDGKAAWQYVIDQHDLDRHSAAYVEGVYRKFIWSVKRKTMNLPVTYHQMPIVMGLQGTGKTWFVSNHLCSPLSGFVLPADFAAITETRNAEQWEYPILFLDEMAFASRADVDVVKNRVTSPTISYRPMGSNANAVVSNKATFIGCTNKDNLADMIRDETGNRRFVPLYFNGLHGNERTSPDPGMMLALWRSVDENGPDPIDAIKTELATIQEAQRFLGPVEQWLADFETDRTDPKIKLAALWSDYCAWKIESHTNCKMNKSQFYAKLKSIIAHNKKLYSHSVSGRSEYMRFSALCGGSIVEKIDPRVQRLLGK